MDGMFVDKLGLIVAARCCLAGYAGTEAALVCGRSITHGKVDTNQTSGAGDHTVRTDRHTLAISSPAVVTAEILADHQYVLAGFNKYYTTQ